MERYSMFIDRKTILLRYQFFPTYSRDSIKISANYFVAIGKLILKCI